MPIPDPYDPKSDRNPSNGEVSPYGQYRRNDDDSDFDDFDPGDRGGCLGLTIVLLLTPPLLLWLTVITT